MAFLPGELVHTNELLVRQGEQHMVECSAHEAAGMLQRRLAEAGG